MKYFEIKMNLRKETKGTYVYEAQFPEAQITTLYIRKGAFPQEHPGTIVVQIMAAKGPDD